MKALSLALCLLTIVSVNAEASGNSIRIFTPGSIKKMLGPYPAPGSVESNRDFETILEYQRTRSEAECLEAKHDESANLVSLFAGPGRPLTKAEAKRIHPRFLMVYVEAGANTMLAKQLYKRPRPYDANPEVQPCIELEGSYAYPSGHTAISRLFARLLSRIYPERADAIMERADEVAKGRVLGGVHHPTDIIAGKKLGDAMAVEVNKSELHKMVAGE